MPANDALSIRVSRIIPAEKWRIFHLLTRVSEFPSFIPTVKEARVLHRSRGVIITRWHIQVDSVPIQWTEEDIIDLRSSTIKFRALEGDLTEFHGIWEIKDHPEGNEVSVNVNLQVDLPALKHFAEPYIASMVRRNFEAILEAMERRLVSLRYTSAKRGAPEKIAGFGMIGHLYNYNHLEKVLQTLKPDVHLPSREFLSQLFHISPSFKLYDIMDFESRSGARVNGCFIVATFIPDMIDKDIWAVFAKVVKACKIAEKNGVGVVTLGGFTSIVAERIGQAISSEVDVAVTTGNTFTSAMAVDGVVKAAGMVNLDLARAKAVIIGGTGDIGSACARVLAERVAKLTLTGRTRANLMRMYAELSRKKKAKVLCTTDNDAAVRDADIVIATASATSAILKINQFKPGAIVCDVGYPKNISYAPVTRDDILIFSGGLAKPPSPIGLPIDIGLPSPEALYGCFSESIILALEKRYENYSFGRGNITPEKIEEMRQMGAKHGFVVSDFYWGDRLIDNATIERIKIIVQENGIQRS